MSVARGFTLLEVLVSLVIIGVGLLGVAGMQMASINNTNQSRLRGLAAIQANSLAAAMHANQAYWQAISGTVTSAPTAGSCSTSACTAAQMAGYDVQVWASSVQGSLPGASGSFSCAAANASGPAMCTVNVSWQEKTVAVNSATVASSAASAVTTVNYQLVVQP